MKRDQNKGDKENLGIEAAGSKDHAQEKGYKDLKKKEDIINEIRVRNISVRGLTSMKKAELIAALVQNDIDMAEGAGEDADAEFVAIEALAMDGLDSPTTMPEDVEDGADADREDEDIGCAEGLMDSLMDAEGRILSR